MKKMVLLCLITFSATGFAETPLTSNDGRDIKTAKPNLNPEKPLGTAEKKEDASKKYPWMDNLSGTFTFASNYMFRGISQTANLPTVQGGLTYTFPLGIYVNLWGSNVKFPGTDATVEFDGIVGVRGDFVENISYDINGARYIYSGANELSYNELNSVFNIYFVQAGLSYSGNVYNTGTSGTYVNGGINTDLPAKYFFHIEDLSLAALIGHYSLERVAGGSYVDYSIALSKKFRHYTLTAQWTDTNGGQHNPPYDTSKIVGTLTAEF